MKLLVFAVALLLVPYVVVGQPRCLDPSGNAVDWWVSLKLPRDSASSDARFTTGTAHVIVTSRDMRSPPTQWPFASVSMRDRTSALGRTMTQVYTNQASSNFVTFAYNDHPPLDSASSHFAHAKGVVHFSRTGGFWLIHSMPRFADLTLPAFDLPDSAMIYGQSLLCVSLNQTALEDVAVNLQIFNPQVYDKSAAPSWLASAYPSMNAFFTGTRLTRTGMSRVVTLKVNGASFFSFGKNARWGKDLYSQLVANTFNSSLFVETWMRPVEPSIYPNASTGVKYETINVNTLFENTTRDTWTQTQDHSKWAISIFPIHALVCVGDINKQTSQWSRGGGTVCMINPAVHKLFDGLIVRSTLDPFTAPTGANALYPTPAQQQDEANGVDGSGTLPAGITPDDDGGGGNSGTSGAAVGALSSATAALVVIATLMMMMMAL